MLAHPAGLPAHYTLGYSLATSVFHLSTQTEKFSPGELNSQAIHKHCLNTFPLHPGRTGSPTSSTLTEYGWKAWGFTHLNSSGILDKLNLKLDYVVI
jgi:hypothetical protein